MFKTINKDICYTVEPMSYLTLLEQGKELGKLWTTYSFLLNLYASQCKGQLMLMLLQP